jgi:hypothetical protein
VIRPTVEELKKVLAATHARRREVASFRRAAPSRPGAAGGHAVQLRREAEGLLRAFYTRAGLDVEKLDQLGRQIRRDGRDAFERRRAEAVRLAPQYE